MEGSEWIPVDIGRPLMANLSGAQLQAIQAWSREHGATNVRVVSSGPRGAWVVFETPRANYNRRVTRRGKIGF